MHAFVFYVVLASYSTFSVTADAISCYSCESYGNGPCFNPAGSENLVSFCSAQPRSYPPDFNQMFGDAVNEKGDDSLDIRCLHYERFYYLKNKTEVYRGCISSKLALNICDTLTGNQNYLYYNLTKCKTCNENLCNSGETLRFGVLASLGVLTLSLIMATFNQ